MNSNISMKITIKDAIKRCREFTKAYRIENGKKFTLSSFDPEDTGKLDKEDKAESIEALQIGVSAIAQLQERLYSEAEWALLVVLQAMDAAGKDSAIKHVFSGVNPQGCKVASFKSPSSTELRHDYLWRCIKELPERGYIGIFNRSYYEEVLSVRVHPEFLRAQNLPAKLVSPHIWKERYEDINAFEKYISRNGIVPVKVFLNLSKEEQRKRFLARLEEPEKNWKFSSSDIKERAYWEDYQEAMEEMIRNTATPEAPWYVVPADNKWYSRIVIVAALVETLGKMALEFPAIDDRDTAELEQAKVILSNEKSQKKNKSKKGSAKELQIDIPIEGENVIPSLRGKKAKKKK